MDYETDSTFKEVVRVLRHEIRDRAIYPSVTERSSCRVRARRSTDPPCQKRGLPTSPSLAHRKTLPLRQDRSECRPAMTVPESSPPRTAGRRAHAGVQVPAFAPARPVARALALCETIQRMQSPSGGTPVSTVWPWYLVPGKVRETLYWPVAIPPIE